MEATINDFISSELVQDASLLPLGNSTSLLESGIVDSLGLLRLVVFIQQQLGVALGDEDLIPENFESVDAICACIRSRDGGRTGQAVGRG
ncbi:MAG TPA: acyl carrier protein [Trebonia sp.]